MKLVLLMAMVLASCGDDRCEPSDLDGSYLVTYTRESGTCADISPVIVQYDNGRSVEDPGDIVDCIQLYSNFSADACELNESYTCTLMDEGIIVNTKLHQEVEPGGDRFDAVFSMEARTLTGVPGCHGVYRVTGVRE